MIKTITAILLILGLNSTAQGISVDTLFIPILNNYNYQNEHLKFPIIKTGNPAIGNAINKDLKNRLTDNEYPNLPTDSTIVKWADDMIISLDFNVTFTNNNLISLQINAEGCGAYCTPWTEYFTYNYKTGEFLTIDKIININGSFKDRVIKDKDHQYAQQKKELKEMLLNPDAGLDSQTYQSALSLYEGCQNEFTIDSFALYPDYLEIIDNCSLPHAIKNLTPIINLKYKYAELKRDLKMMKP